MNKIPMRSGCFIPGNLRLNGLILALALGLTTLSSMANMSPSTNGRIHGRAPDVTGTPTMLMPDGVTKVSGAVPSTAKPADFSLALLESSLTYLDADGDAALGTGFTLSNPEEVILTWERRNNSGLIPLSADQLSQPLNTNFAVGTVLTVSASVPINVTSATGLPSTGGRSLTMARREVTVRNPFKIDSIITRGGRKVNSETGPRTWVEKETVQIVVEGYGASKNSEYTFTGAMTGGASGATAGVSQEGIIRVDGRAVGPIHYTVTVAHKSNPGTHFTTTFTLKPDLWFFFFDGATDPVTAAGLCEAKGTRVPTLNEWSNSNNTGVVQEWANYGIPTANKYFWLVDDEGTVYRSLTRGVPAPWTGSSSQKAHAVCVLDLSPPAKLS